jgi:hypothetical protein
VEALRVTCQKSRIAGAVLLAGTIAVGVAPAQAGTSDATRTAHREAAVDRRLSDSEITESSGLARSTFDRGVLWTHNDSGDLARVFAVAPDGETRAELNLEGADAIDWEDISTGPGHSIWVGDIGDNGWSRDHITVYKFTEPESLRSSYVSWESYDLEYEDGARDAEALLVRPSTGRLFIVSKDEDGGDIYRAPRRLSTSSTNTLVRVASAPHSITGATFAPGGSSFVLVNYTRSFVYSRIGGPVRSEATKANNSSQGESVEIGRGGNRLFLGQEGSNSPVYRTSYRAP